MKQSKRPARWQKECMTAHFLNPNDWRIVGETEFYLKIINVNTGLFKSIDKFRR